MNAIESARILGVSPDAIRRQFAANARQLDRIARHAEKLEGEYRGKPASYWRQKAREYQNKSEVQS